MQSSIRLASLVLHQELIAKPSLFEVERHVVARASDEAGYSPEIAVILPLRAGVHVIDVGNLALCGMQRVHAP